MFFMSAVARAWRWVKLKNKIYERTYSIPLASDLIANRFQYFHDVRLVRAFEIQEQAAADGDSGQLGHRLF